EIGAHALQHNLTIDVDHVRVTYFAAVDHTGHLHARLQFVRLNLDRENADLAALEVSYNLSRQFLQRPWRQLFQNKGIAGSADLPDLAQNAGRDLTGGFVGDKRYLFL